MTINDFEIMYVTVTYKLKTSDSHDLIDLPNLQAAEDFIRSNCSDWDCYLVCPHVGDLFVYLK